MGNTQPSKQVSFASAGKVLERIQDRSRSGSLVDTTGRRSSAVLISETTTNRNPTNEVPAPNRRRRSTSAGKPQSVMTETPILNAVELNLVRKSWAAACRQGRGEPGLSVMHTIFSKEPEIARVFRSYEATSLQAAPTSSSYSEKKSKTTGSLRSKASDASVAITHAETFTKMMDKVIRDLERPNKLAVDMRMLGVRHQRMLGSKLHEAYLDSFGETIVERSVEWTAVRRGGFAASQAWCKVMLFVVSNMRSGLREVERTNMRRRKSTQIQ